MKEIKTFDELWKIQDEKWRTTVVLDLMFERSAIVLVDGYALIVGADCRTNLEMFFLSFESFNKMTDGEKEYIQHHYLKE